MERRIWLALSARRTVDELPPLGRMKIATFIRILSGMPGPRLLGQQLAEDVFEALLPGLGCVLYTAESDGSILICAIHEQPAAAEVKPARRTIEG